MTSIFMVIGIVGWIALLTSIYVYKKAKDERLKSITIDDKESTDPNVVVIGGGTGQSVFLRGLKKRTRNITAIVTVADDGGGSGVLREDLGMLPPGDIRNCLLALANIEPTMKEVMQYRFTEGALKGQSFGNLFLAAMNGLYGNFEVALYKMSQIFAITGKVLPVTLNDINLIAKLKNGKIVKGESRIPKEFKDDKTYIERVYLDEQDAVPLDEVINSIENADIIIMGPGSLYTSIIPNLLVNGVVDAIEKSKAPKVYICNIMTQPGETDDYKVSDHINTLNKYLGKRKIDVVIANNGKIDRKLARKYSNLEQKDPVILDTKEIRKNGTKILSDDFAILENNVLRHDTLKLGYNIFSIILKENDLKNGKKLSLQKK